MTREKPMDAKFLKIVMLAAVSDGQIQQEELEMLNQIKNSHPYLKNIDDEAGRLAMADVYNKFAAGMETKHILEQLAVEFSDEEKNAAFALAKEVCAADFKLHPNETAFLRLVIELWSIPEETVTAVNRSIELRYSI